MFSTAKPMLVPVVRPSKTPDSSRIRSASARAVTAGLPHAGEPPSVVLLTAVRNGKPGAFDLMPPLIMRDGSGRYTEMARAFIDGPAGSLCGRPPAGSADAHKEI